MVPLAHKADRSHRQHRPDPSAPIFHLCHNNRVVVRHRMGKAPDHNSVCAVCPLSRRSRHKPDIAFDMPPPQFLGTFNMSFVSMSYPPTLLTIWRIYNGPVRDRRTVFYGRKCVQLTPIVAIPKCNIEHIIIAIIFPRGNPHEVIPIFLRHLFVTRNPHLSLLMALVPQSAPPPTGAP